MRPWGVMRQRVEEVCIREDPVEGFFLSLGHVNAKEMSSSAWLDDISSASLDLEFESLGGECV